MGSRRRWRARGTGVTYLSELIDKPALGQGPCVVPGGDDHPDWLYVEDVARAVMMADHASKTATKAFNVVGDFRSTREMFDQVRSLLPDADMSLQTGCPMGGESHPWNYDGSAAREEIGYIPEFKIEEGVKRNINMLREKAGLGPVG